MFDKNLFQFEKQSRLFEKGDLKYVILNLLKERSSHGYEIMRALEDSFHGFYTPSAGSVYPTLQLLDEQGYVNVFERDSKKVYTITEEGLKFLEENREDIERIECQMKDWWGASNREEFHETIRTLRGMGRMLRQRGQCLTPEKWNAIKDTILKTSREVEDIIGKE